MYKFNDKFVLAVDIILNDLLTRNIINSCAHYGFLLLKINNLIFFLDYGWVFLLIVTLFSVHSVLPTIDVQWCNICFEKKP